MKTNKLLITTFLLPPLVISIISMIHVVDFFKLTNPDWLAISLAGTFELAAICSLGALMVLEKIDKSILWVVFFILTGVQCVGNVYYGYHFAELKLLENPDWINSFSNLFGLNEEEQIFKMRIIAGLNGLLPIISLSFIKFLVNTLRPTEIQSKETSVLEDTEKEEVKKKPSLEEKMLDSMSEDDKQKLLDFIKEKTEQVDQDIKEPEKEDPKPEEEIKEEPQHKEEPIIEEQKQQETQSLPGPLSSDINEITGDKGSKWAGRARVKGQPG